MVESDEERNEMEDFSDEADYDELDVEHQEDKETVNDLMHKKHVETLKFLREVLADNRELRDRLNLLQNDVPEPVDDEPKQQISVDFIGNCDEATQTEGDEGEKESLEEMTKQWSIKKAEYEKELNRVDEENEELKAKNDDLEHVNKNLIERMNQMQQNLSEWKHEHMVLEERVRELTDENKEIPYLTRLNQELHAKNDDYEAVIKKNSQQNKSLSQEISYLNDNLHAVESKWKNEIKILNSKLDDHSKCSEQLFELEDILSQKQAEIERNKIGIRDLNEVIVGLKDEIEGWKFKLRNNENNVNFKDFVNMKRELNAMKQDKCAQSPSQIKGSFSTASSSPTTSPLPPLKDALIRKKLSSNKPF